MSKVLLEYVEESNKGYNANEERILETVVSRSEQMQRKRLQESVVSQDIARFTNFLTPLIRYVYPRLIAHELLGVQPLTGPSGYLYAILPQYTAKDKDERATLVIYEVEDASGFTKGQIADNETIVYIEDNYILVTAHNGVKVVGDVFDGQQIKQVYSNNSTFTRVLNSYSEANVSDEVRPDINNIGFTLERKVVEATENTLRGSYSIEMYQDLITQFGVYGDIEMMSIMANEIATDLDASVVRFVNENAGVLPDFDLGSSGVVRSTSKARELMLYIANAASMVAQGTKRNAANILLCSPRVANLLATLDTFALGSVTNTGISKVGVEQGVIGVLDGRMKVIVDPYATQDYATVLYRGANRRDAMGFFCPYVLLNFQRSVDSQTSNNVIFAQTRNAISTIPGISSAYSNDRAQLYAKTFAITGF